MCRMNFIKLIIAGLFFYMMSPFVFAASSSNELTVAGYWQSIDGKTKKPSSIIHIESKGQFFEGKIVKTYSLPDERKVDVCDTCRGEQKNKPIIGLTIIKHMVCEPTFCSEGTILDPRDGSIYHATMKLVNGGKQLYVHGYVGIPLFGKTVIWTRVSASAVRSKK